MRKKKIKKSVTFIPREVAEVFPPLRNTHLISIIHPQQATPFHHDEWNGITELLFDDVTMQAKGLVLFNQSHAKEVVRVASQDYRHIVVHCEAGMSRSAAVAKWISDNYDYELIMHPDGIGTDKYYNTLVYDVLDAYVGKSLRAYYEAQERDAFLNPEYDIEDL